MHATDLYRLEKLAEGLALLFYLLMFVALVMALAGSTGSGFLLLIIGSCAHVGQAGLSEFVDRERGRGRSKPEPAMKAPRRSPRVARPVRATSAPPSRVSVRSGG